MKPEVIQRVGRDLVQELIERDVELPLPTAGLSMGTTIRDGDSVLVRNVSPDKIHPGDIVIWRDDNGFTAHRVLYKRAHGERFQFLTKGDGHLAADPPIWGDQIIGQVTEIRGRHGSVRLESVRGRIANRCHLWYGRLLAGLTRMTKRNANSCTGGRAGIGRRILLLPATVISHLLRYSTKKIEP